MSDARERKIEIDWDTIGEAFWESYRSELRTYYKTEVDEDWSELEEWQTEGTIAGLKAAIALFLRKVEP